jgi:hypothetical protein
MFAAIFLLCAVTLNTEHTEVSLGLLRHTLINIYGNQYILF